MSLYFKLCRSGKLNRLSGACTSISFLTIIVQLLWPTPQNMCPISSVKSDSTHHFFGNACTKSGPFRFHSFRLLNDFFCLLTYEFCLSLLKDCSVFGNFVITLMSPVHISRYVFNDHANLVSNQPLIDLKMFHLVTCKTKHIIVS
jgi:hypothetical protein